jgi:pyruvate dehydrogenase E1 component beta subunit
MRPIVEVMTVNFSLLAFDQIVNNAATLLHMSGGQVHVPVVIRIGCGIGRQLAAQHSHSWEPLRPCSRINCSFCRYTWRCQICCMPLFKVQTLWFCSSTFLLNMEKKFWGSYSGHYHRSQSKKRRKDISIITYGAAVYKCLEAANELAKIGIEAEVVDLRVYDLWTKLSWLPFLNTSEYCGRSLAFRQYFCWSIG